MTDPQAYFPQLLFSTAATTPRVMIAPPRYIQGEGALDDVGRYLSLLAPRRLAMLISERGQRTDGQRIAASLQRAGIDSVGARFGGECSADEVEKQTRALRAAEPIDALMAVGGGKCVDAGKCIAFRLGVPLVVVPTLASNDAPCSAVSVIYTADGVSSGVEFFPNNPALVVVDTRVVANAPERYLVAGMGDALATHYEARVCLENPAARTPIGARPTLAASALGETCARTLYESGIAAAAAVRESRVDDALERVVEANTLLSGVGFESGGLAIAHAIAQGCTEVSSVRNDRLHGEMVAMGLLTQLVAERKPDEARRVAGFCAAVGLPITLEQISLRPDRHAELDTLTGAAIGSGLTASMPFDVDHALLRDALIGADRVGRDVAASAGDAAYRRLQAG